MPGSVGGVVGGVHGVTPAPGRPRPPRRSRPRGAAGTLVDRAAAASLDPRRRSLGPARGDLRAEQVRRDDSRDHGTDTTRVRTAPGPAGTHRSRSDPRLGTVIRISDLPCLRIASRYSSQSECSPEMQRKYSTSPSSASWLGMSSTSAVPSTWTQASSHSSESTSTRRRRVAAQVDGLGAVGVRRDHDPALGVDAAGDRRDLRASVGAGGHQDEVVAGADEVEQLPRGRRGRWWRWWGMPPR